MADIHGLLEHINESAKDLNWDGFVGFNALKDGVFVDMSEEEVSLKREEKERARFLERYPGLFYLAENACC